MSSEPATDVRAAVRRTARALVSAVTLWELAQGALEEMRDALGLEIAVLFVPPEEGRPVLQRFAVATRSPARTRARERLVFDEEAWRLAVQGDAPPVMHDRGEWLMEHPFAPPAAAWFVLRLLGDLLGAGIAAAQLRQELQRTALERERMRLAAEVHDGLAQDLALAMRELAVLDVAPTDEASRVRLRAAVASAHGTVRARLAGATSVSLEAYAGTRLELVVADDGAASPPPPAAGGAPRAAPDGRARAGRRRRADRREHARAGHPGRAGPSARADVGLTREQWLSTSRPRPVPHLAVLLRGADERPRVLASFYALGARRGGWLAHRALPGDADHEREVLTTAGLDVAGLEASDRMVIAEIDFASPPEGSADSWEEGLDAALARGCTGLWYARFPVDPAGDDHHAMLRFERVWHRTFRDRPVVTLCPFIVGGLDGPSAVDTLGEVSEMHTGVLVPGGNGDYSLLRPG